MYAGTLYIIHYPLVHQVELSVAEEFGRGHFVLLQVLKSRRQQVRVEIFGTGYLRAGLAYPPANLLDADPKARFSPTEPMTRAMADLQPSVLLGWLSA